MIPDINEILAKENFDIHVFYSRAENLVSLVKVVYSFPSVIIILVHFEQVCLKTSPLILFPPQSLIFFFQT